MEDSVSVERQTSRTLLIVSILFWVLPPIVFFGGVAWLMSLGEGGGALLLGIFPYFLLGVFLLGAIFLGGALTLVIAIARSNVGFIRKFSLCLIIALATVGLFFKAASI